MLFPEHFPTRLRTPLVSMTLDNFIGVPKMFGSRVIYCSAIWLHTNDITRHLVIDIDTLEDWHQAELMWHLQKQQGLIV